MKKLLIITLLLSIAISCFSQEYVTTCRPKKEKYWTGRVDLYQKIDEGLVVGKAVANVSRSWIKFDLSSIPDNAQIKQVDIKFYVDKKTGDPSTFDISFNIIDSDPVSASKSTLSSDIKDNVAVISCSTCGESIGYKKLENMTTLNSYVESGLVNDYITIGLKEGNEDSDNCHIHGYSGNAPQLDITYTIPVEHDLFPSNGFVFQEDPLYPGGSFEVNCNQGYVGTSEETIKSYLGYYLSKDNIFSDDDVLLDDDSSTLSASDSSDPENATLTLDEKIEPGNYYVIFYADYKNDIDETDESNNLIAAKFTISEPVSAEIDIKPISLTYNGEQLSVGCTVTNNGSFARTFGVGAEIKDGEIKMYNFAERTTILLQPGASTTLPYYHDISNNWFPTDYTFHVAVWDETPGSSVWLNEDNEVFTVKSPHDAEIIDFVASIGGIERETNQKFKVQIKNTGKTTRSFWVGLSLATEMTDKDKWPDGWLDFSPMESKIIKPNSTDEVEFDIKIPSVWDAGQYYAETAIWNGFDEDNFIMVGLPSDKSYQYNIPFDRLTWHKDLINKEGIGKKTFLLPLFEKPLALSSVFQDFIYQYNNISLHDLYNTGKKPLLYFSGGIQANFFGTNASEGLIMFIDLADYCGFTPEGKEGWTTIWVANQMKGARYDVTKIIEKALNPVQIPDEVLPIRKISDVGMVFQSFDFKMNGIADYREDKISYGKVAIPGFSFTSFSYEKNGDWEWFKPSIGGSFKKMIKFDLSITGVDALNYIKKIELRTGYLTDALELLKSKPTSLNDYRDKVFETIDKYKNDPSIYRESSLDDGYWEVQKGIAVRNLSMKLVEENWGKSMHLFKIEVPENAKNLTINTSNGTGDLRIYWRAGSRLRDNDRSIMANEHSDINVGITAESSLISNPEAGYYYFALTLGSGLEGYENVTLVVDYDVATNIDDKKVNQSVYIHPNPTKNIVNINCTSKVTSEVVVKVVDYQGRMVKAANLPELGPNISCKIDLSQLAPGIYFIHVENSELNTVFKVFKQ